MFARVALERFNLLPSDVTFAAIGGDHERYNALIGGVVDAAVVSNEYLPLPTSRHLKMLVAGREAGADFLRICMYSTGKVLKQRGEDAIRFLTAQSKALRYALSHRDETVRLTLEIGDGKPDDPRPGFVFDDAVQTGAITPDLPIPMDKLAWMQRKLVELGQIPHAGDLANMVDASIRVEAMKRIGN
jgi:NitT/TauT family transport system substrate-binding protein